MKIVFDARMYGHSSGIEVYIKELAKRLIQEDNTNNEWYFLARKNKFSELGELLSAEKVKIVEADFGHYSWGEQIFLPRLLKKLAPDIVHFPNFNAPILYKGPFVVTIHDMVHHKLQGDDPGRFIHRFGYKQVMNHAVLRSRAIITISKESKKDILHFFPQVSEDKIYVISQGIDSSFLPQEQPGELFVLKERYNLVPPYILFVGVWERKKNLPVLAKMFSKIAAQFPQAKLVLAGREDPHHPEVKDQTKQAAGRFWSRIASPGFVESEDLPILYRNATVFVSASTYEGFGLPGLEAMASGTPVVVADTPVFREVYGEAAKFFSIADIDRASEILKEVLGNEQLREKLSQQGIKHAKKYSWESTALRTLALYNEIAK